MGIDKICRYTSDISLAKNALAFTILSDGIPIIYAGQEQHYSGGNDPANREAVWLSGYSTTSELYKFIAVSNQIRNHAISVDGDDYLTYKVGLTGIDYLCIENILSFSKFAM